MVTNLTLGRLYIEESLSGTSTTQNPRDPCELRSIKNQGNSFDTNRLWANLEYIDPLGKLFTSI